MTPEQERALDIAAYEAGFDDTEEFHRVMTRINLNGQCEEVFYGSGAGIDTSLLGWWEWWSLYAVCNPSQRTKDAVADARERYLASEPIDA